MMMKMRFSRSIAAFAPFLAVTVAYAAAVTEDAALSAASGFLNQSTVAKRVLAGRTASSARAWGNVWIVSLSPSGYVEVAGTDKCAPVFAFSPEDFTEPDAGDPMDLKLRGDSEQCAAAEADASREADSGWAKLTAVASPATGIRLLAAPTGNPESSGYAEGTFVDALMSATWHQTAPFNDLSPYNYFCGCMATAAGQEVLYWRWPYRYEKNRESSHGVRDGAGGYHTLNVRADGRVPFDWDKVLNAAPNPASTPWAVDKVATYNTAFLSFWMQSLTGMGYKPGGSGGTRKLATDADKFWYESEKSYAYSRDGYDSLWAAIKADLDWGSPIQVNTPAHQMVVDGYAIDNPGTDSEIDYINLNVGYGYKYYWTDLKTAVQSGTYSGRLADFQIGYRPQKIVQFEPVPKVSGSELTLTWHLPWCYTNRTDGFTLAITGGSGVSPLEQTITTHEETTTYTATGLEPGGTYTFTVTPKMKEGEGTGLANSVTTTISESGETPILPAIEGVSSVACGIELVQQGVYIECARGIVNDIKVTCNDATTGLEAYSSHLTILPDEKISVAKSGNVFTISVDAVDMASRWNVEGEMIILTLVAKNADGTEAYKNLMLRFNSMRQLTAGTYTIVDENATGAVYLGEAVTLDASGKNVVIDKDAFYGTATVTLTDTIGGGSFTFESLEHFTGKLAFPASVMTTLPDLSSFSGAVELTGGAYTLASDVSSSAKIILDGAAYQYDEVTVEVASGVTVGATVSGYGTINIASGDSVFTRSIASQATLVNLTGGTLTVPADDSDYSYVQVNGGTLKVKLTEAQTQLGYDWTLPLYKSGDVKFILADGTEEPATVTKNSSNLSAISHATDANVWTGTDPFIGDTYSSTANWSKRVLPGNGDFVIFNPNGEDGWDAVMTMNASAAVNLGYVQVRGETGLEIADVGGVSSAIVSADVLENQVVTKIKSSKFQPKTVIPKRTLYVSSGYALTCDLDYRYVENLKQSNTSTSALTSSEYWQGTVVCENVSSTGIAIDDWGNSKSAVRFKGVSGSFVNDSPTFAGTLELVDDGDTPAFDCHDGSGSSMATIAAVKGDGTFKTSGGASSEAIVIQDISGFTGSFDLASKTIAIADSKPASGTGNTGVLNISKSATVAEGKSWKASGGLYLGANAALTVNGSVETSTLTVYGGGASMAFADGSSLAVSNPLAGDYSPSLAFGAATWRFDDNLRETQTATFTAPSGKWTTLDANGHAVTLGAGFFSGAGDVYLTSSASGGSFVIEGVSADYTGTIIMDISAGVTVKGDLSNAKVSYTDIILTVPASSLGTATVGAGATLAVTVSALQKAKGLTISTVSLVDGGVLVIQDEDGKELDYTTEDGKYILAADEDVELTPLLDYEFNGNMNSTGTDTTALVKYSGSPSYFNSSALYTYSVPYINNEFAMPDDEWTTTIGCTMPAANIEKPTIVLMFGVAGGNLFGLVAGTEDNTVALATRSGLIGEAVKVENATSQYHLYTIVKTPGRVKLYVDGELKVSESATVSVTKKFQIGSIHGSNDSSYAGCTDTRALVDFMRFYDFAADEAFVKDEFENTEFASLAPTPTAVWLAGEFDDAASDHAGYAIGQTMAATMDDDTGNLVVGDSAMIGANISLASASCTKASVLVKFKVPEGGAPAANAALAGVLDSSGNKIGALCTEKEGTSITPFHQGSSDSSITTSNLAFANSPVLTATEGYMLFAFQSDPDSSSSTTTGTALYLGDSIATLAGGNKAGSQWRGKTIATIAVGGPVAYSAAGPVPWTGFEIEALALFVDQWLTADTVAYYSFPEPEAPAIFSIEVPANSSISVEGASDNGDGTYSAYDGTEVTVTYSAVDGYVATGTTSQTVKITADTATIAPPSDYAAVTAVAQIEGGDSYATIQAAIDAAEDGDTVKLLASTSESVALVDKSIILVENGCSFGTISGTGTLRMVGALPSDALKALLQDADNWKGTLSISGYSTKINNFSFNWWGNVNSIVRVDGINGYAGYTGQGAYTNHIAQIKELQIVGGGLELNDTYGKHDVYIDAPVTGSGKIAVKTKNSFDAAASGSRFIFAGDVSGYTGGIDCSVNHEGTTACSTVVFLGSADGVADDLPTATAKGQILVSTNAIVSVGGNWKTAGGVVIYGAVALGAESTLTGSITLAAPEATLSVPSGATAQTPTTTLADYEVKAAGSDPVVYSLLPVVAQIVITPDNINTIDVSAIGDTPLVLQVAYTSDGGEAKTVSYENILKIDNGKIVLDPEGEVGGVSVVPEIATDDESEVPFDVSGDDADISVKTIPGLWYDVRYGDKLVNGGIGGATGATEPKQATGSSLKLTAPKDGDVRFYQVEVNASKPQ